MSNEETSKEVNQGLTWTVGGMAVGAGTSTVLGGMGLAVGGTAIGIGMAPVAAVGAVAGTALYGAVEAVKEKDPTALGVVAVGTVSGLGAASVLGGMGLAVGGTAIAIGAAPVAAAGGVLFLAGYGVKQLWDRAQQSADESEI